MPAPIASDFSVPCICAGNPVAICAPGLVQYKQRAHRLGSGAPQRRECGVCHGTGRIHREHGPRAAFSADANSVTFHASALAAHLSTQGAA